MTPTMEAVAGWLREAAELAYLVSLRDGGARDKTILSRHYTKKRGIFNDRAAQVEGMGWRPIDEAPIGGGAESVVDPNWVEPPELLLLFPCGKRVIGNYSWYHAEGGWDYNGLSAWVNTDTGDQLEAMYGAPPTHFMPLPQPPVKK